ncbi:MAG TPA: hypothetical protein VEK34_03465 [Methylocella sp.]|nr:hypothetical protein [Methylocella sp.]
MIQFARIASTNKQQDPKQLPKNQSVALPASILLKKIAPSITTLSPEFSPSVI